MCLDTYPMNYLNGSDNCRGEEKFQCVAAQDENSVSFQYT